MIDTVADIIVMLRRLSADEQVRMEFHKRWKRLHDEATALDSARREGKSEGVFETLVGLVKKIADSCSGSRRSSYDRPRVQGKNRIESVKHSLMSHFKIILATKNLRRIALLRRFLICPHCYYEYSRLLSDCADREPI